MNQRTSLAAAFGFALFVSGTVPARAEPNPHVGQAQKAYAAVDFEATRREAKAALEGGGNDLATTRELYVLLGTSAAALDQPDEARVAFSHALAANPALKLDRDLSPKMRAPYQEARGSAVSTDGKPPLEASLARTREELELTLRDQLQVAGSVELWLRTSETGAFARRRFEPARARRLPAPRVAELQYYLRVLDRYSNVLYEVGTAEAPRHLALAAPPPRATSRGTTDVNRTPYLITAGSLGALGLAAGGVATAMVLRREDAAREWNGPGCEQPGATRRQQCDEVDDRRRESERLAIGFAVGGGALLVGSVLTLLLTPSATTETRVAVDADGRGVMLRLRTAL
jgi:hypothetical protein